MEALAVVVGAVVLLVPLWLVVTYNRFVRQRQLIDESWADIDVELNRRHDLIPNLVETVKGYAAHERALAGALVRTREDAARTAAGPRRESSDDGRARAWRGARSRRGLPRS